MRFDKSKLCVPKRIYGDDSFVNRPNYRYLLIQQHNLVHEEAKRQFSVRVNWGLNITTPRDISTVIAAIAIARSLRLCDNSGGCNCWSQLRYRGGVIYKPPVFWHFPASISKKSSFHKSFNTIILNRPSPLSSRAQWHEAMVQYLMFDCVTSCRMMELVLRSFVWTGVNEKRGWLRFLWSVALSDTSSRAFLCQMTYGHLSKWWWDSSRVEVKKNRKFDWCLILRDETICLIRQQPRECTRITNGPDLVWYEHSASTRQCLEHYTCSFFKNYTND